MATSGAGFGASGFLQGFAQAYNAARVRGLQYDLEQRHGLASTLMQLYPNARPEAQQDIAQRLMQIYQTPVGKKLDKKLGDIGSLGQAQVQQQAQGAQQATTAGTQGMAQQTAAPQPNAPNAQSLAAMPPPSGIPANTPGGPNLPISGGIPTPLPPSVGGIPGQPAALTGQQSAIPAPPQGASPFYSPEERAQIAAQQTAAVTTAQYQAKLDIFDKALKEVEQANPGITPSEAVMQARMKIGESVPFAAMMPSWRTEYFTRPGSNVPIPVLVNPKVPGSYMDSSGRPIDINAEGLVPWKPQINSPSTEFAAYLQAGRKQGLSDDAILNNYNQTSGTSSNIRIEKDVDGNFVQIPVTTTTTKSAHGALPSPPSTTGGNGIPTPPSTKPKGASGGPRGASTGAAIPIVDAQGNPIHQPLAGEAKKTLFQIDAGTAMLQKVLPDLQAVVNDIGRGGNIYDSAQVRSAWNQYLKMGIDPANVDPNSIVSQLPNVDPRIARMFPTLAQLQIVAAQPYLRGVRRYEFVQKVMQHIPDPEKDTPQLMLQKAQQLQQNLPLLKNAIYESEGVKNKSMAATPSPASTGATGKTLSMAQIQQAAKDHGVSVEEATRQAKAAGYTVQ